MLGSIFQRVGAQAASRSLYRNGYQGLLGEWRRSLDIDQQMRAVDYQRHADMYVPSEDDWIFNDPSFKAELQRDVDKWLKDFPR